MKKLLIFILIIIIIIALFVTGKMVIAYMNDNIQPIIYYSFNDNPNIPLNEENSTFANNITIMWTKDCKGTIKRDGELISKNNGTLLTSEGIYEILEKSPTGKNQVIKKIKLDKTPPKVNVSKTSLGTYEIVFANIADIGEANLLKFDLETNELISKTNLLENGLKTIIEIKEKGYYVFNAIDKIGNSTESIEFIIE